MSKKIVISCIIGALLAISAIAAVILLASSPERLGNMNAAYSQKTTAMSDIMFTVQGGERIKFSFRSEIENGELNIILYDSKDVEIYELDSAKELEAFFTLKDTDTYTLKAECTDFIGNYSVDVYKA